MHLGFTLGTQDLVHVKLIQKIDQTVFQKWDSIFLYQWSAKGFEFIHPCFWLQEKTSMQSTRGVLSVQ